MKNRDYYDALESKFLGSGLTAAQAKRRFSKARRELRDAPKRGRGATQALGMDARLKNANSYLTRRKRRDMERRIAKYSKAQLQDVNFAKKLSRDELYFALQKHYPGALSGLGTNATKRDMIANISAGPPKSLTFDALSVSGRRAR